MINKEFVVHKDEVFWVLPKGKYYCSGRRNKNSKNERLLHRRIWSEYYGEIPIDHHIHHVNNNWRDNNIENLHCIPRIDHQRMHMFERFQSEEFKSKNKEQLEIAQEKAKKWHASSSGKEWHSKNAREQHRKRKIKEYTCVICNIKFLSKNIFPPDTCSISCCIKNRNDKSKVKYESLCKECGTSFKHGNLIGKLKYKGCSRKCSISIKNNASI